MAEFSLGAAIGATGRFPRYTAPTPQKDEYAKEAQEELRNLRNRVSIDKKKYHRIYEDPVKDMTIDFYNNASRDILSRDPGAMNSAFERYANWDAETNKYVARSESLKALENYADLGRTVGKFVPNSVIKARNLINQAKNEEDLLNKIQENKDIFLTGYVTADPTTGMITAFQEDAIPFDQVMQKTILTKDKANVLNLEKTTEGNIAREYKRYTIPADKAELAKMKGTMRQLVGSDPGEIETAYDLGWKYFSNNPTAQKQYRALKFDQGDDTVMNQSPQQLYDGFYKDYVVPNIPNYDESKQTYVGLRTSVYVGGGAQVAPTKFQIAQNEPINYGGTSNVAKVSAVLSKDPDGTDIDYSKNIGVIRQNNLKGAFGPTQSGALKLKVSRLYVLPSGYDTDIGAYRPLNKTQLDNAIASGNKPLYLPWASASAYPDVAMAGYASVGQESYWIPVFNPTVVDGKTRMIITPQQRQGNNLEGSNILNALFLNQKLDPTEKASWTQTYQNLMKQVVDSNDIKK